MKLKLFKIESHNKELLQMTINQSVYNIRLREDKRWRISGPTCLQSSFRNKFEAINYVMYKEIEGSET